MLGILGVRRAVEAEQEEQRIRCELANQRCCISHSASKEERSQWSASVPGTVLIDGGEFEIVDQMVYVVTIHGSICEARFRWLAKSLRTRTVAENFLVDLYICRPIHRQIIPSLCNRKSDPR